MTIPPEDAPLIDRLLKAAVKRHVAELAWASRSAEDKAPEEWPAMNMAKAMAKYEFDDAGTAYAEHRKGKAERDAEQKRSTR